MDVDLMALLVFVGGFAVCAGAVFLISIFGAKEQTFEEALAAQKKKNEKEKANKGKGHKKDQDKKKNWRKGKKDREDKLDNMDDGEEEQVIVVPSSTKESLVAEEEPTPEPTPEPSPEPVKAKDKKKNEKKKRIEIEEVEEVIEQQIEEVIEEQIEAVNNEELGALVDEDVEPVAEVDEPEAAVEELVPVVEPICVEVIQPLRSSPVKQQKKKDKANKNAGEGANSTPKDLLSIIKRTAFNDAEAQNIIDVLLTKQSGDILNTSEEWIEKGKPTESQKLRQQLTETEKMLEEEQMKGKSVGDKLTSLRQELNQEKAARASHNRVIEEMTGRQTLEVNGINNKMQGFINENSLLKGQLSQLGSQIRDVESMRVQYQATIDNLSQQLQMANVAAANASANDPHLLSELEQLRTLRDKYENTLAELSNNNSNLASQMTAQTDELTEEKKQLTVKLEEMTGQMSDVQTALANKTEEAVNLTTAKSGLEAELLRVKNVGESLQQQLAAERAVPAPTPAADPVVEAELANVKSMLAEKEQETVTVEAELASVKSKLSEKEKETVTVEAELVTVKSKLSEKDKETATLMEENERLSEQLASSVERPAAEGEESAGINGHVESTPEPSEDNIAAEKAAAASQQAEEWREKFEILHMEHEKMLAKQKMLQSEFEEQVESYKGDLENVKSKNNELNCSLVSSKECLVRLFPSLSGDQEISVMETKARASLEALSTPAAPVVDNTIELQKLENQVSHYKTVLAQTESMLNSLQASVESAEGEWRGRLEIANKELSQVKVQNTSLVAKVSSLESSVDMSKQVEEMQVKLVDLQEKLAGEEKEKEDLKTRLESLGKDIEKEKGGRLELSNKVSELSTTNTSLQQVLVTTKEALDKESGVVRALQMDQDVTPVKGPRSSSSIGSARSNSKNSVKMQGQFYGKLSSPATACPFPDEWQYGTIPETIANEDDLD